MRVHLPSGEVLDGEQTLVVVELTPEDRANIANMAPDATLYAEYPEWIVDDHVSRVLDRIKSTGG